MSVNYSLIENRLTSGPGDYYAKVNPISTADVETVIKKMVDRGSTVTSADIRSVLDELSGTIVTLLEDGMNITLPFANYSLSIKGTFIGPNASFDPASHKFKCKVQPGKEVSKSLANNLHPVKKETIIPRPTLISFTDINSGNLDSTATPGGLAEIKGNKLQFDASNPDEGIFFIAEDKSAVRAEIIGKNVYRTLMFIIPGLAAGDYFLEVRNSFGNELRTGRFGSKLTVV